MAAAKHMYNKMVQANSADSALGPHNFAGSSRLYRSNRMRFQVSEVQRWLERTGRKRWAANGRAATLAAVRKHITNIPVLKGIKVVIGDAGIENWKVKSGSGRGEP